jgi:hypothetical protein
MNPNKLIRKFNLGNSYLVGQVTHIRNDMHNRRGYVSLIIENKITLKKIKKK